MDTLTRFIAERQLLIVLDNCEHLLDASAALVMALLAECPGLTLLTTSREPIGVAGEVSWRVPSLSLANDAIELFIDRARRARADFIFTEANSATVTEICGRLDGLPLAIELAAARLRALSLTEILDSLHDRFRLLTGGSRMAVRRQQTLRASVDWSHALLTEPERVLLRRLAAFMGGFDLEAAQSVCGGGDVERFQVLDQLTLLVDKSLVVADDSGGRTRYRLLETVRQYALEKLSESGEADAVRTRHRDYYTAMATVLDAPAVPDHECHLEQAQIEIDNLRAAFGWSLENCEIELALTLASSLQPLWQARGRMREGLAWFDAALTDLEAHQGVMPVVLARSLADKAMLAVRVAPADSLDQAQQALVVAREADNPALLARALTACGFIATFNDPEVARRYFADATELAHAVGDRWRLSQILAWQAEAAFAAGDPLAMRAAGQEGRELADAIGDRFVSRLCRWCLGVAQMVQGDLAGAAAQFAELVEEARSAHDGLIEANSLAFQGSVLAHQGDTAAARTAAASAIEAASELGDLHADVAYATLAGAALAAGDVATALDAIEAWPHLGALPVTAGVHCRYRAEAALAGGHLAAARRAADEAVTMATGGVFRALALISRARVAIAAGEIDQAETDARDALALGAEVKAYALIPDILECLAVLAGDAASHREAARLFGSAHTIRARMGSVRFKIYEASYEASLMQLREALGEKDFDAAWSEGTTLSVEEAIAYAQRGRGERKRPTNGWGSLTPTERQVVQLVSQGLANNDIATRLFVSPRTVQTHLTHVYSKLGLTSRVQLAQEAARHA
jgi:predicted ATPase/DNA-binding CsgD family transcriptional regulator